MLGLGLLSARGTMEMNLVIIDECDFDFSTVKTNIPCILQKLLDKDAKYRRWRMPRDSSADASWYSLDSLYDENDVGECKRWMRIWWMGHAG